MKKIIITVLFIISFTGITLAQTNANQPQKTDSTSIDSPQVEFYSSMEEFEEKNPSYLAQLTVFVITQEVYISVKKNAELYHKEILASR